MRLVVVVLVEVLLSACATRGALDVPCPGFASMLSTSHPSTLEQAINTGAPELDSASSPSSTRAANELADFLAQSTAANQSNGILLLSGGGQWGAYGAAFMNQLRLTQRMPEFPLITGVSTGALQAIFVGVGDPPAYARMIADYSPERESDIVKKNLPPLAFITGSMAGLRPLRALVEKEVCSDEALKTKQSCMLDQLKGLKGKRKILLGFVGAHDGQFHYVDVVELANSQERPQARECIVGAALASAAMPGTFQQVRVDHQTYYDGGVRLSVFQGELIRQASRARAIRPVLTTPPGSSASNDAPIQTGARPEVDYPIYVIRNGPTTVQPADTKQDPDDNADLATNAMRADQIVTNQLEVTSIAALRLTDPNGPIFLTNANGTGCVKKPDSMFDPAFMQCLRDVGARRGQSATPWKTLPPLDATIKLEGE